MRSVPGTIRSGGEMCVQIIFKELPILEIMFLEFGQEVTFFLSETNTSEVTDCCLPVCFIYLAL